MRPTGSKAELEARRIRAVKLVAEGRTHSEVSRMVGTTPSTVTKWWKRYEAGGVEALQSKRHPGRKPLLANSDWARLEKLLLEGPEAHGTTGLWTCERVAKVIRREFGVKMHTTTVLRARNRLYSAKRGSRFNSHDECQTCTGVLYRPCDRWPGCSAVGVVWREVAGRYRSGGHGETKGVSRLGRIREVKEPWRSPEPKGPKRIVRLARGF